MDVGDESAKALAEQLAKADRACEVLRRMPEERRRFWCQRLREGWESLDVHEFDAIHLDLDKILRKRRNRRGRKRKGRS